MDLMRKIADRGVPLAEYAGVKPLRSILTGLNEAFLIDTRRRDQLVTADRGCDPLVRPYLRGRDVERWHASWDGLWMIAIILPTADPWLLAVLNSPLMWWHNSRYLPHERTRRCRRSVS